RSPRSPLDVSSPASSPASSPPPSPPSPPAPVVDAAEAASPHAAPPASESPASPALQPPPIPRISASTFTPYRQAGRPHHTQSSRTSLQHRLRLPIPRIDPQRRIQMLPRRIVLPRRMLPLRNLHVQIRPIQPPPNQPPNDTDRLLPIPLLGQQNRPQPLRLRIIWICPQRPLHRIHRPRTIPKPKPHPRQ